VGSQLGNSGITSSALSVSVSFAVTFEKCLNSVKEVLDQCQNIVWTVSEQQIDSVGAVIHRGIIR
jgi:hypothetical protein